MPPSYTLLCGTWNVNEKKPPQHLREWLASGTVCSPDVIAVALEELTMTAVSLFQTESPILEQWVSVIQRTVNSMGQYALVVSKQLSGIGLVVFASKMFLDKITDVAIATVPTGFMNQLPNKGGVLASLRIEGATTCFVASHLAAHTGQIQRRNRDYHEICRRANFPDKALAVLDHDYVFWMGDLNYRIDPSITHGELVAAFAANADTRRLTKLWGSDQLNAVRASGDAFESFTEAPIYFPATYKFSSGKTEYIPLKQDNPRYPAWCDRILWHSPDIPDTEPNLAADTGHETVPAPRQQLVECLEYTWCDGPLLLSSDHRPVRALFRVYFPLSPTQPLETPRMTQTTELSDVLLFSSPSIDFGRLDLGTIASKILTLTNKSETGVSVSLSPLEHDFPQWLRVTRRRVVISPGESVDIEFSAEVSAEMAPFGRSLDTFVVICDGSHTLEFPIIARWELRVLGRPIEELLHETQVLDPKAQIPLQLWWLGQWLQNLGLGLCTPHLFLCPGDLHQEDQIIECLQTPVRDFHQAATSLAALSQKEEWSPQSVASALLLFISVLPNPLWPMKLMSQIKGVKDLTSCGKMLQTIDIPATCAGSLFYLFYLLRDVIHNCTDEDEANKLLLLFARAIFRPPEKELPQFRQRLGFLLNSI